MSSFTLEHPEHIGCHTIYDTLIDKYRPLQSSDFAIGGSGGAGSDAFGRLRVSNPEMIFNSKQIFDNQPLFWDDIQESGSGTSSSHSVNTASTTISVSANTAGKRTRQTYMRFNYQPGKSQLIFMTGVLRKTGGGSGIFTRMGIFDNDNGLFFEGNETINLVVRTKVTGSVQNQSTSQVNWNLDRLDGTGPSGLTLDFTKSQIFVIDFEWLGVGRIRFGFNINGITYYCHESLNSNINSGVYMSTPNLPLRYQVENDGTGQASSIECICSAISSEGGKEEIGVNLYSSTDGNTVAAVKNQLNAIIGHRLKAAYKGCTIDILDIDLLCSTLDNYEWQLVFNPTIASTFSYSGVNGTPLERAIGNGSSNFMSGGTVVAGGYGTSKSEINSSNLKALLKLGSSITGAMDTLVLGVYPLGNNNMAVSCGMSFRAFI